MNTLVRLVLLVWLLVIVSAANAQLKTQCATCFGADVVKAEKVSSTCTDYAIKVYYTGHCDHALSHFTVNVPSCATVSNITADAGWGVTKGYDPTTGLNGFKIECTSNFGQSSRKSFLVSFTLCSSASCDLSCWSPVVAFKASTCFEQDTIPGLCPKLVAHLVKTDPTCNGSTDGSVTAIVDEGTSPYTYAWSTGATGPTVQNLGGGDYSVVITDATGTVDTLETTLVQPEMIAIGTIAINSSCSGKADGSITLSVSGGSGGPYNYLWNTGDTTASLDSLKNGIYAVIVTDSAGCTGHASAIVGTDKNITLSATTSQPQCNQSNGSLSVVAIGGTDPYAYQWSTGEETSALNNIPAGTYSVTVTDAEGCSISSTYLLKENNTLKLSYQTTPTSCVDDASGTIDLTVAGGTGSYTYLWSNGDTTQNLTGLSSGVYSVTVTDSAGCEVAANVYVPRKNIQVSTVITTPLCFGDSTGSIVLTPVQGTPPFEYSWSNGDTGNTITGVPAGTYTVTVTDSTGCSTQLQLHVTSPAALKATTTVSAVTCSESSVDLTVTGGTYPYQYAWSTGETTQDLASEGPGTYDVTITDAHGCTLTKSVTIDRVSLSCLIDPVASTPDCLSTGNKLTTNVSDATYQWAVTSTDGSWQIESGADANTLTYTAGNAGTTATFTLTVSKNECSQSCSYTLSTCTSSGGSGSGDNSESCADCFSSTITQSSDDGGCASYIVHISTDGNCRYDLSHFVIAIPCGQLTNYSDSGNWPLVTGKDPTTGLTGLKVDNINGFGKTIASFTLTFTVCYDAACGTVLSHWNPVVAYKAGQCVAYDTLALSNSTTVSSPYPNPFHDSFYVDVSGEDKDATIVLYDQFGHQACAPQRLIVDRNKSASVDASSLPSGIYFYELRTAQGMSHGRVMKLP